MALSDIGIFNTYFSTSSPKSTFTITRQAGKISFSAIVCGFICLATSSRTG